MHEDLINRLGGAAKVRRAILAAGGPDLTPQAISLWKKRGVAHRYRPLINKIAITRGIDPPKGFLITQED